MWLVQVVDRTLLVREVDEMPAATVAAREDNNGNEIEIEADEEFQDKPEELHWIKNACLCSRI